MTVEFIRLTSYGRQSRARRVKSCQAYVPTLMRSRKTRFAGSCLMYRADVWINLFACYPASLRIRRFISSALNYRRFCCIILCTCARVDQFGEKLTDERRGGFLLKRLETRKLKRVELKQITTEEKCIVILVVKNQPVVVKDLVAHKLKQILIVSC